MDANQATAATISAECVPHITDACYELEQLIRLLGTMRIDSESDMAIRGIAVRMNELHHVVFGAIIGSIEPEQALATVRGPAQWFNAA